MYNGYVYVPFVGTVSTEFTLAVVDGITLTPSELIPFVADTTPISITSGPDPNIAITTGSLAAVSV